MRVFPKLEFKFTALSWVHDGDHGEVREGRGDVLGGRRWAQFRPLTSTSWEKGYTPSRCYASCCDNRLWPSIAQFSNSCMLLSPDWISQVTPFAYTY